MGGVFGFMSSNDYYPASGTEYIASTFIFSLVYSGAIGAFTRNISNTKESFFPVYSGHLVGLTIAELMRYL